MSILEEKLLLSVSYEMEKFSSDWRHCDYSASYLAQLISSRASDPTNQSIMLSTVINELLEVIYHLKEKSKSLMIEIKDSGSDIIIDFCLSMSETNQLLFTSFFNCNDTTQLKKVYLSELKRVVNNEEAHRFIGLYEIIADYDVQLSYQKKSELDVLRMKLAA
jgi:hypothetical protein